MRPREMRLYPNSVGGNVEKTWRIVRQCLCKAFRDGWDFGANEGHPGSWKDHLAMSGINDLRIASSASPAHPHLAAQLRARARLYRRSLPESCPRPLGLPLVPLCQLPPQPTCFSTSIPPVFRHPALFHLTMRRSAQAASSHPASGPALLPTP